MGLLNSAGECVRPSLLVLLFSDHPYPAGGIIIVVIVGPLPPHLPMILSILLFIEVTIILSILSLLHKMNIDIGTKILKQKRLGCKTYFPDTFLGFDPRNLHEMLRRF